MKLYPFDVPEGAHPLSWVFYGFGLDATTINQLCRHLFDDLGARLETPEPREVTLAWAVDWPLDVSAREVVSVGDDLDEGVGFDTAVTLTSGALPPGIRLVPHTGRLVGTFKQAGLYQATFRLGPKLKYDPLGGPGGPGAAGKWIPIDQPRQTPPTGAAPARQLEDMDLQELEDVIVRAQAAQRAKAIHLAEGGARGD
ncbi:hypothetical protein CJEDD_01170 [Corynebacterium jeddahense]|uniref:Uncharacterized protein n=2 Tax=Corynebacterium jeddahense TaxID=1414719 RepID=A0ABY7UI71_9CORY|nr:hypothetical protein CJEDD_01170 [Corynebacterium jeddahense]